MRGRVESVAELNNLPVPYKFGRPYANKTTSPEPRIPGKAPNHSINWNIGNLLLLEFMHLIHIHLNNVNGSIRIFLVDDTIEIVTMMTGKTVDGNTSRLAKISLASEFMKLLNAGVPSLTGIKPKDFETYGDAKLKSTTYEVSFFILMVFLQGGNPFTGTHQVMWSPRQCPTIR